VDRLFDNLPPLFPRTNSSVVFPFCQSYIFFPPHQVVFFLADTLRFALGVLGLLKRDSPTIPYGSARSPLFLRKLPLGFLPRRCIREDTSFVSRRAPPCGGLSERYFFLLPLTGSSGQETGRSPAYLLSPVAFLFEFFAAGVVVSRLPLEAPPPLFLKIRASIEVCMKHQVLQLSRKDIYSLSRWWFLLRGPPDEFSRSSRTPPESSCRLLLTLLVGFGSVNFSSS